MDYKVNSVSDNSVFVETESYRRLLEALEVIRESRGNILHVVGAPGTGKSANLYRGIQEVGLDVYEVPCNLESADVDADYVFRHLLDEMKAELGADNRGIFTVNLLNLMLWSLLTGSMTATISQSSRVSVSGQPRRDLKH